MLSRRLMRVLSDGALLNASVVVESSQCCSRLHLIPPHTTTSAIVPKRYASSSSSTRWQSRQGKDRFVKEAKVQGLKSRAAFKLLAINARHKIFKKGQTVVDLGYAPGSWTQVAVDRTRPNGRVIGIDIIPVQPPEGASTIQGNFLSPNVQAEVKEYLRDPNRGRPRGQSIFSENNDENAVTDEEIEHRERGIVELERRFDSASPDVDKATDSVGQSSRREKEQAEGKTVDVVLSDMSEPWAQTSGFWKRSLSNPHSRMMNVSGINFRDHAGSMDLCAAALQFCYDTLRTGGHFVCKFYQGSEDKALEMQLRKLFTKVHREKPESSRSESRESYFVALKRKDGVGKADIFPVEQMEGSIPENR